MKLFFWGGRGNLRGETPHASKNGGIRWGNWAMVTSHKSPTISPIVCPRFGEHNIANEGLLFKYFAPILPLTYTGDRTPMKIELDRG